MSRPAAAALLMAVLLPVAPFGLVPADASADQPVPPPPADAQITGSVSDLQLGVSDLQLAVSDIEPQVEDLETTSTQGAETVVTLSTDVLFDFGKSVLPPSAPAKLNELTTGVPRGGSLKVHGFTDSIGSDQANLALSRARAEAVAEALRGSRSDLTLDVDGFGEGRPVAPNTLAGEDNPDGRAKNRRVELRFSG
jgi:outer membrane protein OmpA-like peptidoglycan-associated protein